jgi:hypothetical protein
MPAFESDTLKNLASGAEDVDETIDLCGLPHADALAQVDRLVANAPPGRRYHLRFSPPCGDGRETLFLPLGRHLLAARRAGRLTRCLPTANGAGYLIVIASS